MPGLVSIIGLYGLTIPGFKMMEHARNSENEVGYRLGYNLLGYATAAIGIFILDLNNGSPALQFNTISIEQGLKVGATFAEIASYNEEQEVVAALTENLTQNLSRLPESDIHYAMSEWRDTLEMVNPLTKSMILKIAKSQVSN